jgi:hypothetical protein
VGLAPGRCQFGTLPLFIVKGLRRAQRRLPFRQDLPCGCRGGGGALHRLRRRLTRRRAMRQPVREILQGGQSIFSHATGFPVQRGASRCMSALGLRLCCQRARQILLGGFQFQAAEA